REGKVDKTVKQRKAKAEEQLKKIAEAREKLGLSAKAPLQSGIRGKTLLGETTSSSEDGDTNSGIDFTLIKLPDGPPPPAETHVMYSELNLPEIMNPALSAPQPPTWIPPPTHPMFPPFPGMALPISRPGFPPAFPHSFPPFQFRPGFIPPPLMGQFPMGATPMQIVNVGLLASPPKPAVISAEAQLRDLQKELVAFVPAALKRSNPAPSNTGVRRVGSVPRVNAAPDVGDSQNEGVDEEGGVAIGIDKSLVQQKKKTANDEYEEFMKEMEGLL
ncbi:hypothetical protein HK096_008962, partial [Nowakowskiella sp. JEL0078]